MDFRLREFWLAGCAWAVTAAALSAQTPFHTGPAYTEPARLAPFTQQQARAVAERNQQTANVLAAMLRNSAVLSGYSIDLAFQNGVVDVTGFVSSPAQIHEVERILRASPDVYGVVNRLQLQSAGAIVQTQILNPPRVREGPNTGDLPAPPFTGPQEPTPIFQAPPHARPQAYQPPRMPPYAWPTYAPYNNYSRVGYPTIYPRKSFPFIGPFHPFPKVPLGWRSVSLTWQDGFWWYGRNATGHDWWQVRFW